MADEDDLKALRDGDEDLVGRDFSDADLTDQVMTGRDFERADLSRAIMNGAVLTGSNLREVQTYQLKLQRAILDDTKWASSLSHVDFTGARFSGAQIRAVFQNCILTDADFRGCDLSGSHFDGNELDGAISDETTNFTDVPMSRNAAKHPLFRFFEVKRGKLARRPDGELKPGQFTVTAHDTVEEPALPAALVLNVSAGDARSPDPGALGPIQISPGEILPIRRPATAHPSLGPDTSPWVPTNPDEVAILSSQIDDAVRRLRQLTKVDTETADVSSLMGHNNPPADAPLTPEEIAEVVASLEDVKSNANSAEPDIAVLQATQGTLARYGAKVMEYVRLSAGYAREKLTEVAVGKLAEAALDGLKSYVADNWFSIGQTIIRATVWIGLFLKGLGLF